MKRILALLLAIGLFSSFAFAHEGIEHVMGTVASITDSSITVKATDGKLQTVVLNVETKYAKIDTAIARKDIKVGDHVAIHAKKKEGQLIAVEVKVGMDMKGMDGMKGMKMDH